MSLLRSIKSIVHKQFPLTIGNFFSSQSGNTKLIDTAEILPSSGDHKATIIWMHGLGDSSAGFSGMFSHQVAHPNIRVVLPNSPVIPITINNGMEMPAWYDIVTMDRNELVNLEDEKRINQNGDALLELLESECEKVPSEKILVGGFSQGAAMAVHVGLRSKEKLAGIMACSGYVVLAKEYPQLLSSANKNTPIFAWHGKIDPMVPIEFSKSAFNQIKKCGVPVEYHEEEYLEHNLSPSELQAMVKWWTKQLDLTN